MDNIAKSLPEMLTGKELDEALKILPEYDNGIKEKSAPERLVALQDIYNIFIPSRMSREIYSKMYLSLLRSLKKKQSVPAIRQYSENSKMIKNQNYESIIGGSDSFTIIGESGIGKSSAVSRAVNILSESPILEAGSTVIIPCLQVQAPADSSVKGLLLEILRKTDELLRTKHYENAIRSHATTDMLIGIVSQVALNHIGLLIVDEIQNVVNSKNGKVIVGTLTQLINNSGVSICMVGTPESTVFFDSAMMLARRSLGLNYTSMDYGDEFRNFCKAMLLYCYVKEQPKVDEALFLWLYNHSKGNVSIVSGIIHDAQEIAILEGSEKLNISAFETAYERRLYMLHEYIDTKKPELSKVKSKHFEIPPMYDKVTKLPSIFEISRKSKKLQIDVVAELKNNGIKILEVEI